MGIARDTVFAASRQTFIALAMGLTLIAAAGCSTSGKSKDGYIEGSVEDLYNRATDMMAAGNYKKAAKFYDEVDRQHPYSSWATRAQLMAAYAHYKDNDYDAAVIGLNRFISLHPGYRNIAYAYYLKGLAHFDRINDVRRDQNPARKAVAAFNDVVKRFPSSKYARDSKRKIDLIRDHLAAKEMEVGRFYQKRGQHLAAVNRFRLVVGTYQTTSQVPEALHRLAESYTALGVKDEARKVAAILGHNYPSSEWYADSYALVEGKRRGSVGRAVKDTRGLLERTWDWIF